MSCTDGLRARQVVSGGAMVVISDKVARAQEMRTMRSRVVALRGLWRRHER